jgi:hypothetical protein
MAGGLINIVSYGSQDLYLTGTPEITHFKVVFRRHTNFSMESIELKFEDKVDFGLENKLVFPQIGDLIHKLYLKFVIPSITLNKQLTIAQRDTLVQAKYTAMNDAYINMIVILNYTNVNTEAYRQAYLQYLPESDNDKTNINNMINVIKQTYNGIVLNNSVILLNKDVSFINKTIQDFTTLITLKGFVYDSVGLNILANKVKQIIINDVSGNYTKDLFLQDILNKIDYNNNIVKYFENIYQNAYNEYNAIISEVYNYKFAWVKKLAHSLIEYIDLYIGGERIDRQYGEWVDIWYELAGYKDQEETYNKMIGNISELTTFNATTKPSKILYVPLNFWFNRYNGSAIPLVAMEYSKVSFNIKLRRIEDVCYMEDISGGDVSLLYELFQNAIQGRNGLEMTLYTDYIYLDSLERKKFAQSGHEYIIEQVQYNILNNININQISTRLDFSNTVKELIWICRRKSFVDNSTGKKECKWWNYGVNSDGTKNPINFANLEFNGYTRIEKYDGSFFNYLQPLYRHRNTPSDGVNVYSFCLNPEENQPSGTANFSRLNICNLTLYINDNMFINNSEPDLIDIYIFAPTINVLRIIGGYAACAFV